MLFHFYKHIVSRFTRTNPSNIALLVTEHCNARCVMCNIWKDGFSAGVELSIDNYDELLSNRLFKDVVNVMISGGEALLRKDIEQIISCILTRLPRLKRITIATNGLNTDLINKKMLKIASIVNDFNGNILLISQISFDALTEVHDQIRAPGASIKVKNTIDKLVDLRNKYSFYKISAGCVIQPMNVDEAEGVFDYLKLKNIESIFTVICFDDHYYGNSEIEELYFKDDKKNKLKEVLKKIEHKEKNIGKKFLYSQFRSMLDGGTNNRGCPALSDTITINSTGDVIPCLNSGGQKYGNILSENVRDIWFSADTRITSRAIINERCAECMFACGVGYFNALEFAIRTIGGRFF